MTRAHVCRAPSAVVLRFGFTWESNEETEPLKLSSNSHIREGLNTERERNTRVRRVPVPAIDPIKGPGTAAPPYAMAASQSSGSCNQYSVVGVNPATSQPPLPLPRDEQGGHTRPLALMEYSTPPTSISILPLVTILLLLLPPSSLPPSLLPSCLCPVALVRK